MVFCVLVEFGRLGYSQIITITSNMGVTSLSMVSHKKPSAVNFLYYTKFISNSMHRCGVVQSYIIDSLGVHNDCSGLC